MASNAAAKMGIIRTVKKAPDGYLDLIIEEPWIGGQALPGQFVMLRFTPAIDPILPRPFDIVETTADRQGFRLIIKIVGSATKILEAVRPGDRVQVTGPLGAPITDFQCASLALLVRGCGAAAVLYFMQSARRHRIAVHTVLSASTAAKFILQEELAALSESLSLATDDGSAGQKALGSDVLKILVARQPVDRIYSCGGGPFYLPALEELEGTRRAPVSLFLESYMACGFGYCHGCAVSRRDGGYSLVCQDGPLYKLAEVKDPCLIYQ